uniref:Uncharacterized protein n=1 Tax=Onchocerca volvulus TaxID=6282 RepID=A0A8R1TY30_ONCVO
MVTIERSQPTIKWYRTIAGNYRVIAANYQMVANNRRVGEAQLCHHEQVLPAPPSYHRFCVLANEKRKKCQREKERNKMKNICANVET